MIYVATQPVDFRNRAGGSERAIRVGDTSYFTWPYLTWQLTKWVTSGLVA